MANLAASAVTVNDSWWVNTVPGGKVMVRDVTLVLSAMGSATNKIEASTLRFNKILDVSPAVKSDNSEALPASPSYDQSLVLLYADAHTPADATGTYRMLVTGNPV